MKFWKLNEPIILLMLSLVFFTIGGFLLNQTVGFFVLGIAFLVLALLSFNDL